MNTPAKLKQLDQIRRLTRLLDTAFKIPGLGIKVGLDPIIGLLPGVGDLATTILSAYIIFLAARFQLPKGMLVQMFLNVALEFAVGTVPFLGDFFDAFFKSNVRNLALLEKHLSDTAPRLQAEDVWHLDSAKGNNLNRV
ncbi:MAG: DUF4112 domain-containing protein [Cyanobacteria bacterium P01_C01_bin.120]